jgi:hypothetical protein
VTFWVLGRTLGEDTAATAASSFDQGSCREDANAAFERVAFALLADPWSAVRFKCWAGEKEKDENSKLCWGVTARSSALPPSPHSLLLHYLLLTHPTISPKAAPP